MTPQRSTYRYLKAPQGLAQARAVKAQPEDGLRLELNPGRAGIRDLAILDLLDAKERGDVEAFERASRDLVRLNERLFAEEAAERGYLPQTVEGMIAVLNCAARIIEAIGGQDE